ncbi:MAG: metallophosphoesterase [Nitrospinae bacterium]|nr:metallophosphoesterase [Nitrospinota bacterium]
MLVVISDLHFVDETAGKHNLPYGAFEDVFLSDIVSIAKDKGVEEIKLLLLGDIVDLIRSEQWFDVVPADRPWGTNGLKDIPNPQTGSPTEQQCMKILGEVQNKNQDTFKLFREFKSRLKEKYKLDTDVEIIYTPGNHDRLCNLYPSVRDKIKNILGLTVNTNTAIGYSNRDWKYRYDFIDENYGIYARHGHQFDEWNYAVGSEDEAIRNLEVSIGDLMTTEFAVKFPYILNSLRGQYSDIDDNTFKELVEHVKDIDNIRPIKRVIDWIDYRIKKESDLRVRGALDKAFKQVAKEFFDIDFVKNSRTYRNMWLRIASNPFISYLTKSAIDIGGAENMLPILMGLSDEPADPEKGLLVKAAYDESVWRNNKGIQFVLYGHTHAPLQIPMDNLNGKEVLYINTGTWRNRITKTIELDQPPDFIELKTMTYAIFYRRDEDMGGKQSNTVSFDVWTGAKKKYYKKN